ncbi:hypothetical protein [Brachybacterium sp. YJGR34]|uniref:hypothetical protein n=1 Tax=Brachybacterium sp. YJGR34 TaxID=2059911 RepID=UPI000E0C0889|nr:hypothetical protein [Brachybacterium sp. YJGR34]
MDWKKLFLGIVGILVSVIIVWFGIAWATSGVSLSQSVLLGGIVAVLGIIRLADAARQFFAATDTREVSNR